MKVCCLLLWEQNRHACEDWFRPYGQTVSKRYFSWQYNKIIGFLTVNYNPTINIIIFDIALDCKKHPYDSNNKGPIIKQNLLGEHFRVDSKMTNAEIQGEIKDYVKRLSEVDLKRYYVDKRAFENIINVVDFKSIISSI